MNRFVSRLLFAVTIAAAAVPFAACGKSAESESGNGRTEYETPDDSKSNGDEQNNDDYMHTKFELTVGGRTFVADRATTEAAEQFIARMPLTLPMKELNGNEKYHYLDFHLPTEQHTVTTMHEGDIMLWGDNCIVVFYETFQSGYSYTEIGHIADTAGLKEALGSGSVTVGFAPAE